MRLLLAACALLVAALAQADERILSFRSDIEIHADSSLIVTETIRVRAEGHQIQRGIYRDFPTEYRDAYNNRVRVDYEPLSVLRNDAPENFFSKALSGGVRTYFGDESRYIESGEHTYQFRYRINRVLGYFEAHDELYWNVTGNDWAFPIDEIVASIELTDDGGADIIEASAYTGYAGEQGGDYSVYADGNRARFESTRPFRPHEGLTTVVTWPKGYVTPPGTVDRIRWLLADNAALLTVLGGLGLMLAYLLPVWQRYGRDPEEGLIVTRYEPPPDLPPASLRYVRQMYYDNKVMTAAVVSLAVKGFLRIEEERGDYTLVREPSYPKATLPGSEQALLNALFAGGDRLELDDKYHARVGGARKAHRDALRREFHGRYFLTNGLLNTPAYVIAVLTTVVVAQMADTLTPLVIAGIALLFLTNTFFTTIMKRPTVLGRQLLDEVLGFRDYLDIAEKDELNLKNPPERTPELFERYLPYALALGVEQNWGERFASVLAGVRAPGESGYSPAWYSGNWRSGNLGRATSRLSSSLNSSISSSATPPGSSSGSGGGGSSGGGGGGGGGGGW